MDIRLIMYLTIGLIVWIYFFNNGQFFPNLTENSTDIGGVGVLNITASPHTFQNKDYGANNFELVTGDG